MVALSTWLAVILPLSQNAPPDYRPCSFSEAGRWSGKMTQLEGQNFGKGAL